MSEAYLKEIQLPSKGLLYEGKVPDGLVTIEPMGTREEKLFSAGDASGSAIIGKVIKACTKLDMDHEDLIVGDRLFLLLHIRMISYGNEYVYPYRCSHCRKRSVGKLNLAELQIKYADEENKGTYEVELPVLGHRVTMRQLTGTDEQKVRKYGSRMTKVRSGNVDDVKYVYRLARMVELIDGEQVGIKEAIELIESLKGIDSLELRDAIEDNGIGPMLDVNPTCSNCGFENGPMPMPWDSEFFRPRRRRTRSEDYIEAATYVDAAQ